MAAAWAAAGRSPVKAGYRKPTSIATACIAFTAILLLVVAQRSWLPPGLRTAGAGWGAIAFESQRPQTQDATALSGDGQSLTAPPLPRPLAALAAASNAREWREGQAFEAPTSRCRIAPDGEFGGPVALGLHPLGPSIATSGGLPPEPHSRKQEAAARCLP